MDYAQTSLRKHKDTGGKIEIKSKFPAIVTTDDLSIAYTPGVAAVSTYIAQNPAAVYDYTIKGNTIAIVSDGSAVLGLGNIGPFGALPVMEGKALLMKEFANVDAFPLVLSTQNPEQIIATVKAIAPTFGGINLEDISAPRCFEIETRLKAELDIPVFHDDQHGTAIVVLAALINSLKLKEKVPQKVKIVISGAGAAGVATAKLLLSYGVKNIILVDSHGIISLSRSDLNPTKTELAKLTNPENLSGNLSTALVNRDVFIGVSAPNIVTPQMVSSMAPQPIVFALANPIPEIMPEQAFAGGAYIVGTGRSDYPNQINNVLAFPGIFRGLLDSRKHQITETIKLAAARAIANMIPEKDLNPNFIIPSSLNKSVAKQVAAAVANTT